MHKEQFGSGICLSRVFVVNWEAENSKKCVQSLPSLEEPCAAQKLASVAPSNFQRDPM